MPILKCEDPAKLGRFPKNISALGALDSSQEGDINSVHRMDWVHFNALDPNKKTPC